jgi:hypothetical protein
MNSELKKHIEEELAFLESLKGIKEIDLGRGKIKRRIDALTTVLGFDNHHDKKMDDFKAYSKEDNIMDLPISTRIIRILNQHIDSNNLQIKRRELKVKDFEGVSISKLMTYRQVGKGTVKEFTDILIALGVTVKL